LHLRVEALCYFLIERIIFIAQVNPWEVVSIQ
jgi:hypothetical protein